MVGLVAAACARPDARLSPERPPTLSVTVEPAVQRATDPARTEPPPHPVFHYDEPTLFEIEWAKRRFPDELAGVQFGSLINELRAWLPPRKPLEVYALTPEYECVLAELSRYEDLSDEIRHDARESQRKNPDFAYLFRLNLKLNVTYGERDGFRTRTYRTASVDEVMHLSNDTHWDMWVEDEWVPQSAGGRADSGPSSRVLSHVDAGAAYFDGIPLDAWPTCTGVEKLRCPDGSTLECPSCSTIALRLLDATPGSGEITSPQPTCNLRCPPPNAPPDFHRATELFGSVECYRVPDPRSSPPAYALYRDHLRCQRELLGQSTR